MGGMIVQEMAKLARKKFKINLLWNRTKRKYPGRFETIDQSRKKLKINGLEILHIE